MKIYSQETEYKYFNIEIVVLLCNKHKYKNI